MDRRAVLKRSAASLFLMSAGAQPALAAPEAILWERWLVHDPASAATIDHGLWADLLQSYLRTGSDGVNRFAYRQAAADDDQRLERYIDDLAATPISSYSRPEQMAYWINLYNALTVRVVLDHYPVDSIRDIDISPGLFSDGPWGKKLVMIEQEMVSLDDIEHQILRPIWKDPRVHYAVNCASIGCPNLQPAPFTADGLDRELDAAAIQFVNHRRAVDLRGGGLQVSSIYDWFQEDFGGSDRGVIAHLKAYAEPGLAMELEGESRIDDHEYDWRLNDVSTSTGS